MIIHPRRSPPLASPVSLFSHIPVVLRRNFHQELLQFKNDVRALLVQTMRVEIKRKDKKTMGEWALHPYPHDHEP